MDFDTHFFLIHTEEQYLPIIYLQKETRMNSEQIQSLCLNGNTCILLIKPYFIKNLMKSQDNYITVL